MPQGRSKRADTRDGNPTCTTCNRPFWRISELERHFKRHNLKEEDKIPCGFMFKDGRPCPKRFLQNGGRNVHYLTHTGFKPIPCIHCNKRFSDPSHHIRHKKEVHGYIPQPRKYLKNSGTAAANKSIKKTKQRVTKATGGIMLNSSPESQPSSPFLSIPSQFSLACALPSPTPSAQATAAKPQDTEIYLRGLDYHPNGLNADEVAFVEETIQSIRTDVGSSTLGLAVDNATPSIWDSTPSWGAFDNIGQLGNSLWNYTTNSASPCSSASSQHFPSPSEVQFEDKALRSSFRGAGWFARFNANIFF